MTVAAKAPHSAIHTADRSVIETAERFVKEGLNRYSILDRTRILLGLSYAAELEGLAETRRTTYTAFVHAALPDLLRTFQPSKEEDLLEAAANIIEIGTRQPISSLSDWLETWKACALSPRFIGPENDIGRLGIALLILHSNADPDALAYAEKLLEAVIDASRYENERHRFDLPPEKQALAHRLLGQVLRSPRRTAHQRRLSWMFVTHYKYLSRKLPRPGPDEFALEEAFLEHGLLHHGAVLGEKLLARPPAPADLPHGFSVTARYERERQKDTVWLARAKARPTPRLVLTSGHWEAMIRRNQAPARSDELKSALARAETALALDVPVYYKPAPSLDERGQTNEKAAAVGRKMSALRDAYLATGDAKWGKAYKDIVMAQVRQFEDYGDFRCPYNLNIPGPWDGLGAVVSYTSAYDILAARGLLHEDEKDRIIRMVREIGRELEWSLTHSNFIVHNAWARWMGSMGFLVTYWTDLPEAEKWKALVESKLPFLYSGIDSDGGWWEKTINYHLFTLDLMEAWFSAAKKLQGIDLFNREFNGRRLTMMLDWLIRITPPGGEIPLFNDGQKLNLRDSGPAVRMARSLGRGDFFKAIDLNPENVALTEPDSPPIERRSPDMTSVLLKESGYGIFRSGWEIDDFYFAVKFGEHGGGHGHYDKGSIYLHAHSRPWLIDPGYGQKETFKHNTVVVDGRDQEPATGILLDWQDGETVSRISIRHRAYREVDHRRTVLYLKPDAVLVVDKLTPLDGESHTYDWLLQFNTDNGRSTPTSWVSTAGTSGLKVVFPENEAEAGREFDPALNVNELPSNYQKMGNESLYLKIWRGKWTKRSSAPVIFAALIKPFRGEEPPASLIWRPSEDGVHCEVTISGRTSTFHIPL